MFQKFTQQNLTRIFVCFATLGFIGCSASLEGTNSEPLPKREKPSSLPSLEGKWASRCSVERMPQGMSTQIQMEFKGNVIVRSQLDFSRSSVCEGVSTSTVLTDGTWSAVSVDENSVYQLAYTSNSDVNYQYVRTENNKLWVSSLHYFADMNDNATIEYTRIASSLTWPSETTGH